MLENYLSVFILLGIGVVIGVVPIMMGFILGPRKPNPAKLAPYECGFNAYENARLPFDIRYYLVAILFILFDLETAFLVPWAVVFRHLNWGAFIAMGVFLLLLLIGFIYEWKKGALEWE